MIAEKTVLLIFARIANQKVPIYTQSISCPI